MKTKLNKTFIIVNKETQEQWISQSGKSSWKAPNHAKAAFAQSRGKVSRDPLLSEYTSKLTRYESLKFNNQDVYEVVELKSKDSGILKEALLLLQECMDNFNPVGEQEWNTYQKLELFLRGETNEN
jgi:hypothetical protein